VRIIFRFFDDRGHILSYISIYRSLVNVIDLGINITNFLGWDKRSDFPALGMIVHEARASTAIDDDAVWKIVDNTLAAALVRSIQFFHRLI
jgi:hypothetical protein